MNQNNTMVHIHLGNEQGDYVKTLGIFQLRLLKSITLTKRHEILIRCEDSEFVFPLSEDYENKENVMKFVVLESVL